MNDLFDELMFGWKSSAPDAEFPFQNFKIYKYFNHQQERWYVELVNRNNRHWMLLSRYRMSVKLGRILTDDEEVDHKDDNKQNDEIENLQLLTGIENKQKAIKRVEEIVTLICPICNRTFQRKSHSVRHKINNGKEPCCSRRCGYVQGTRNNFT